jgi:hypothetical protein
MTSTLTTSEELRCSFCNKSQKEVRKLIAGPAVYICDECVDACNEVLEESGIPAGRARKSGLRAAAIAEEYSRMALDLATAGNYLGAAREIRNAALAALRGIAAIEGEPATQWSETKVVVTAMEDPEIARLLQVEDRGHVLLRVSMDGAVVSASEFELAAAVTKQLIETVRSRAESASEAVAR